MIAHKVPYEGDPSTWPEHTIIKRYVSKKQGYVSLLIQFEEGRYCISEHRYVAGNPKGKDVHHINEDKSDNRAENLAVVSRSEHIQLHPEVPSRGGKRGGATNQRLSKEDQSWREAQAGYGRESRRRWVERLKYDPEARRIQQEMSSKGGRKNAGTCQSPEWVREFVLNLRGEGYGYYKIASLMNERKIKRPRSSNPWNASAVYRIVKAASAREDP